MKSGSTKLSIHTWRHAGNPHHRILVPKIPQNISCPEISWPKVAKLYLNRKRIIRIWRRGSRCCTVISQQRQPKNLSGVRSLCTSAASVINTMSPSQQTRRRPSQLQDTSPAYHAKCAYVVPAPSARRSKWVLHTSCAFRLIHAFFLEQNQVLIARVFRRLGSRVLGLDGRRGVSCGRGVFVCSFCRVR